MNSVKRLLGVGLGTIALLSSGAAVAPSASASVGDQTCGAYLLEWYDKTFPLCLKVYSNGYNVWYTNNSSQAWDLDFWLQCVSSAGNEVLYFNPGRFTIGPWATRSYFFEKNQPECRGILINRNQNLMYYTKSLKK
ncbi:hypothetical protein [Kitasatospora indigofera]